MHFLRFLRLFVFISSIPGACLAQDALSVDSVILNQHIIQRIEPVYPPIAKAARVHGTVAIDVEVGPAGMVESMKVVSGPAMLQQAALDALREWTFKPFEMNGSPVAAKGTVEVVFNLRIDSKVESADDDIASRYFPLGEKCRIALAKRDNSAEAGELCRKAAEIAEEFSPDLRFIEKRSAFVSAAWALGNCGKLGQALGYANKAVEVVNLRHDDNSGMSAVYQVRGVIEGGLKDWAGADADLTLSEQYARKAIQWAESVKFEHIDAYKWSLAMDLRLHAQLLQGLHRAEDAQKMLDEANTLK